MVAPTDDPALAVLVDAAHAGLRLRANNGRVYVSPKGLIAPELADRLRAHKPAILEALEDPEGTAARIIEDVQDFASDLDECFRERMAVCVIDGRLSEAEAGRVALEQLLRKMA